MPHHMSRAALGRLALTLLPALAAIGLPAVAGAATITPTSGTTCYGSLKHDPTGASSAEPNLLDYKFLCDTNIVAYTIVINRGAGRPQTIDDFDPNPLVYQQDGTPSPTQAPGCSGTIPGNGVNCNIGTGYQISAFNTVSGSFDPVDAYCEHYPINAKPGTRPVPQAQVELIATNFTGGEDGPFPLALKPACPVLKPLKKTKKHKHKSTHKMSTSESSTAGKPN
jgi:hypothetical protein